MRDEPQRGWRPASIRGEAGVLLEARRLDPLDKLSHSDVMFDARDRIESRAEAQ